MKRIFVAIDISPEGKAFVSNYIKKLESEFPNIRISRIGEEKLHITLKFLGEIENSKIDLLKHIVKKITTNYQKFGLILNQTGVFPNRKKAGVLWFGIDDLENKLRLIQKTLENDLKKAGFSGSNQKFKPHLTIARIRGSQNSKPLISKHLGQNIKPVKFDVRELVIYQSELKSTGSVYKTVSKFNLI